LRLAITLNHWLNALPARGVGATSFRNQTACIAMLRMTRARNRVNALNGSRVETQ